MIQFVVEKCCYAWNGITKIISIALFLILNICIFQDISKIHIPPFEGHFAQCNFVVFFFFFFTYIWQTARIILITLVLVRWLIVVVAAFLLLRVFRLPAPPTIRESESIYIYIYTCGVRRCIFTVHSARLSASAALICVSNDMKIIMIRP